jgi:1,2-diacylglycerol 3-alpha-glucosyltransferase
LNIGIFTDTYYPQINGVATSTRLLERELTKKGHNVYIFTPSDPNSKDDGRNIFRIPSAPVSFSPGNRVGLFYSPRMLFKLIRLKLDVVHTQTEFFLGVFGKLASKFFGIPQVHTYHTMYEDYVHYVANGKLLSKQFARNYSRMFCNKAKAVIAPVNKARDSLIDYGVIRPIRVIPTGIDFEPFSRERYTADDILKTKNELGIPADAHVLVSVGRVAKEKSLDAVIRKVPEMIGLIPGLKFVIVGPGPMKEPLEQMSAELGLKDTVIFAGPRPWAEIGKYYQIGDAFICASTSETQGLTYIESMAAKVPVIAKRDKSVEGVVIDGETGYFFDTDDEMPELVRRVMQNREERLTIAGKAFENIRYLSAERFGSDIEVLYNEVIKAFPKRK